MLKFTPVFATCNIPGYTTIHNDQTAYIDYTGEERDYPTSSLAVNLYYEMRNLKNPLTIAMTRMILPVGANVAVLCAFSGSNSLQLFHEGGCALGKAAAAIQFAIGRHKAPTDVPSAQLKTQKDGYYAPDIDKDVRDSHEVQEKVEKKEQLTARQLRHRPERGQSAR